MGRRIGNWRYVGDDPGCPGWHLDGTDIVLDYDPLDWSGDVRGAYCVVRGPLEHGAVSHYLGSAMEFVEEEFTERLMRAFGA